MKLSIVVPCYNEADALPLFYRRLRHILSSVKDVTLELLIVDDGSRDSTAEIARGLSEKDPHVRVLRFSRNFGKEAALLAGLRSATGDLIAVMDADLQDPPELLFPMIEVLSHNRCDCVAARRTTRLGEPAVRSMFARAFYRVINALSAVRLEDGVRDFRMMRREMLDAVLMLSEKRRFSKGLFAWVGFRVQYIEYRNVERVAGVTKWSFWGLLRYALEGIFTMTTAPLGLSLLFAVATMVAGLVLLLLGLWLAAALCGLSALLLLAIFIIGRYVARIYTEVQRRPLYLVRRNAEEG